MTGFVLAAGLGTRLQPLTNDQPKALVPFHGTPLLEGVILKLAAAGIDRVLVNVHHFADQVEEFLNTLQLPGLEIHVSDERTQLMDTGGALLQAREFLKQEAFFIVHNVDVMTNLDIPLLLETHLQQRPLVTMAVKKRPTSRFLLFDDSGILCGWRHNKTGQEIKVRNPRGAMHEFGNSCIQVISRDFLDSFPLNQPMSLTRMYLDMAKDHCINAFVHNEDYWFDLGRYDHFLQAEAAFKEQAK